MNKGIYETSEHAKQMYLIAKTISRNTIFSEEDIYNAIMTAGSIDAVYWSAHYAPAFNLSLIDLTMKVVKNPAIMNCTDEETLQNLIK